jgi:hypothetical protein
MDVLYHEQTQKERIIVKNKKRGIRVKRDREKELICANVTN